MVSGNWLNNDGMYIKYGTSLADPEVAGEFVSFAGNRIVEVLYNPVGASTTAGSPTILSDTEFFPSGTGIYIERVEITAETALAGGTSFNIGLIQADRATIPSGYGQGFIAAEVTATFNAAGDYVSYTAATSKAGSLIGSSPASATGPYYLTAYNLGTYTTGSLRIRIYYHGIGTIAF